jgi:hypothetical protein
LDLLQSKASTLVHLQLQSLDGLLRTWSEADTAAFAATIGSLSLLQSLALQLRNHEGLRKLSIADSNEPFSEQKCTVVDAVSCMLQSCLPLEVLELELAKFNHSSMECLVQGLESNSSLEELALLGNVANETSRELLLRFLQTAKSHDAATCAIRRLRLENPAGTMDPWVDPAIPLCRF